MAGAVDIVFLVDSTGSMGDCIDGLKVAIKDFFAFLTDPVRNKFTITDWRTKVVGYRDVTFDENWIENNPFVRSVEEVNEQVDSLKAEGGGDEPESLLDALFLLSDMKEAPTAESADGWSWRPYKSAARVIIAFTDATYHPTASLKTDEEHDYEGLDYEALAKKIDNNRIILEIVTPVRPLDASVPQKEFEKCYADELGKINRAQYVPLRDQQGKEMEFSDIPKNIRVFRDFMQQIAASVSASVPAAVL